MRQIKHILSMIGIVVVLICPLSAQNYTLSLPSGEITPSVLNSSILADNSVIDGSRFLILQFYDLPNNFQKIQLSVAGVQLFDYIPNYAFLAKVPASVDLSTLPIRAAIELSASDKMCRYCFNRGLMRHVRTNKAPFSYGHFPCQPSV